MRFGVLKRGVDATILYVLLLISLCFPAQAGWLGGFQDISWHSVYNAYGGASALAAFTAVDSNHDGRIEYAEFHSFVVSWVQERHQIALLAAAYPGQAEIHMQHCFHDIDRGHKGYLLPSDWPR